LEVGNRTKQGTVIIQNIEDPANFQVIFGTNIPKDLLNFEEFSERLFTIQGCVALALDYINGLIDTLKERAAE
jgi:hypothetical protein